MLVLTLLVCMVLLGLGLTAMYLSSEGGKISANVSRRGEAYFAAQSGLERGRGLLLAASEWTPMLAGCPSSGAWDASKHIDPIKGRVLCASNVPLYKVQLFETGSQSGSQVGTLNTVEYSIWVRNDDVEAARLPPDNIKDDNYRVIIRAEGRARGAQGYVALDQVIGRGGGGGLPEAAYSQSGMGPTGANSGKASLTN